MTPLLSVFQAGQCGLPAGSLEVHDSVQPLHEKLEGVVQTAAALYARG